MNKLPPKGSDTPLDIADRSAESRRPRIQFTDLGRENSRVAIPAPLDLGFGLNRRKSMRGAREQTNEVRQMHFNPHSSARCSNPLLVYRRGWQAKVSSLLHNHGCWGTETNSRPPGESTCRNLVNKALSSGICSSTSKQPTAADILCSRRSQTR